MFFATKNTFNINSLKQMRRNSNWNNNWFNFWSCSWNILEICF